MATPKPEKELDLPLSRVKKIMKSLPDVKAVGPEPLYLVTKATELFITELTKRANQNMTKNKLEYKNIADVVQQDDALDFLRVLMPRKITVRQFKEMMTEKTRDASDGDSSEERSEEDTSDPSLLVSTSSRQSVEY